MKRIQAREMCFETFVPMMYPNENKHSLLMLRMAVTVLFGFVENPELLELFHRLINLEE